MKGALVLITKVTPLFDTLDLNDKLLPDLTDQTDAIIEGSIKDLDDKLRKQAISIVGIGMNLLQNNPDVHELKAIAKIVTDMRSAFFKSETVAVYTGDNVTNNVQVNNTAVQMFSSALRKEI